MWISDEHTSRILETPARRRLKARRAGPCSSSITHARNNLIPLSARLHRRGAGRPALGSSPVACRAAVFPDLHAPEREPQQHGAGMDANRFEVVIVVHVASRGVEFMHGTLPARAGSARKPSDTNVSSPTNLSDDPIDNWFPLAAQQLLAPKPGLVLHLLTDCGERNGDRYVSGAVKVPSFLVRQLLRSEQGEAWLRVLMDGCDAPWWRQRQEIERDARLFREAIKGRG
jgi:hypothetical protein